MAHQRGHRNPGDLEVGAADLFLRHPTPHVAPREERPEWLLSYERRRPKWLTELVAEAFGVFLYCFGGMGATAAFYVSAAEKETGFGDLLTVGFAYAFAIALAIIIVGPTSGSHINPCFTISFAVFKGFPWRKVPQYIAAQIFGGFIAGLIVYAMYRPQLHGITQLLTAAGAAGQAQIFSTTGPPSPIVLFPPTGEAIGYIFVNEFICTFIIGLAVFSILDPSNIFVSPQSGPILIGAIYFVCIVCYAGNGVALNTARDLGGRFAAACIWGRGVFPAQYTALAALTNIAGTLCGAGFQVFLLSDSTRPPTPANAAHAGGPATPSVVIDREAADYLVSRQVTNGANGVTNGVTNGQGYPAGKVEANHSEMVQNGHHI